MNNRIINPGLTHVQNTDDGKYQLYVKRGGPVWRSNDYGATLTQITLSTRYEICSAISGDGKYQLIGSDNSDYLAQSSNYGITWSTVYSSTIYNVYACALSKDGQYQLVCDGNNVWVSDDYGATISATVLGDRNCRNCAMSESGQAMAVMATSLSDLVVHYSNDYGVTWNSKDLRQATGYGQAVSVTGDGTKMFTCYNGNWLASYTFTTDTWVIPTAGLVALAVVTSYDGKYIAVGEATRISVSNDYGASYTEVATSMDTRYMAMSSTGKYIIAGPIGTEGHMLSDDYGVTFTSQSTATSSAGIPAINRIH